MLYLDRTETGRGAETAFDEEIHGVESNATEPENHVLRQEEEQSVRRAVEELPVELREVIVLRELEGLSYKEIAAIAGIPMGTVMSRLARARERSVSGWGSRGTGGCNLTCPETQTLVHGYVDGELDLMKCLEIEQHLEACPACASPRELQALRAKVQNSSLYSETPPGLAKRVQSSLRGPIKRIAPRA